jgi:hypothetical protein
MHCFPVFFVWSWKQVVTSKWTKIIQNSPASSASRLARTVLRAPSERPAMPSFRLAPLFSFKKVMNCVNCFLPYGHFISTSRSSTNQQTYLDVPDPKVKKTQMVTCYELLVKKPRAAYLVILVV